VTITMNAKARVGFQRRWRVAAIAVAIVCGAFSAQRLWALIRSPLRERSASTLPADVSLGAQTQTRPSARQAVPAVQRVDPETARIGNDAAEAKPPRTLVLVDSSPGVDTRDGTARLGTDPRNSQTYVAGALLLNGARLTGIYRDYVVRERNGESTRLYVSDKAPSGVAQDSLLTVVGGLPASLSSSSGSHENWGDDPRTAAITTYFRPNPVFDGGLLRGVAVYPAVRPAEFAKLGLHVGDVITAVNGVGVSESEQIMSALEQVVSGSSVQATMSAAAKHKRLRWMGLSSLRNVPM
jgi:hypothetical protein